MIDIDAFEDDPKTMDFKDFLKTSMTAFVEKITGATK